MYMLQTIHPFPSKQVEYITINYHIHTLQRRMAIDHTLHISKFVGHLTHRKYVASECDKLLMLKIFELGKLLVLVWLTGQLGAS